VDSVIIIFFKFSLALP